MREIQRQNVVLQQRDYSCGAAALATLLRYYWGHDVTESMVLTAIETRLDDEALAERAKEGLTFADVETAAVDLGYQATAAEVTYDKLTGSKVPVIVVVNLGGTNHFVVYRGSADGNVFLADPIRGNVRLSAGEFVRSWQRNAILVVAPKGETSSDRSRLAIRTAERTIGYLNRQLIRRATSGGLGSSTSR